MSLTLCHPSLSSCGLTSVLIVAGIPVVLYHVFSPSLSSSLSSSLSFYSRFLMYFISISSVFDASLFLLLQIPVPCMPADACCCSVHLMCKQLSSPSSAGHSLEQIFSWNVRSLVQVGSVCCESRTRIGQETEQAVFCAHT